jgi:hypothetical protein
MLIFNKNLFQRFADVKIFLKNQIIRGLWARNQFSVMVSAESLRFSTKLALAKAAGILSDARVKW